MKISTRISSDLTRQEMRDEAWAALDAADREWLGEDRFQRMCQLLAAGWRLRQLYRRLLGLSAADIRGERRGITRRFTKIAGTPQVATYVASMAPRAALRIDGGLRLKKKREDFKIDAASSVERNHDRRIRADPKHSVTIGGAATPDSASRGPCLSRHESA